MAGVKAGLTRMKQATTLSAAAQEMPKGVGFVSRQTSFTLGGFTVRHGR